MLMEINSNTCTWICGTWAPDIHVQAVHFSLGGRECEVSSPVVLGGPLSEVRPWRAPLSRQQGGILHLGSKAQDVD